MATTLSKKPAADAMEVRYEVAGKRIYVDGEGKKLTTRAARHMIRKYEKSFLKQFGHLRHPETGERPILTISVPDPSKVQVKARLDTPSNELRDWLKEQGIVIEDTYKDLDGEQPSSNEAGTPETQSV